MPGEIFVTGTDTNVGKTVVCALLCKALHAGYWKPIQSGITDDTDRQVVKSITGLPDEWFYPESYVLSEPLSPHASAAIDGVTIDLDSIRLPNYNQQRLIVEGAGGVLVPLNDRELVIDLMAKLQAPVIVVARSGLGTINHTLLTLNALRHRKIDVLGVIMNGALNAGNRSAIENYGNTKVLAEVEPLPEITAYSITHAARKLHDELVKCIPYLASVHANEDGRTAFARQAGAGIVHRA